LITTNTSIYQLSTRLKYIFNWCILSLRIQYIDRCLIISLKRCLTNCIASLLALKCWITSYECTCIYRVEITCKCALIASSYDILATLTWVSSINIKYILTLTSLICWARYPSILCITLSTFIIIVNRSYSCIAL